MRLGALASQSRVAQPTMTKLVHGLVALGWAERIADPLDARATLICLTRSGEQALDAWRTELVEAIQPHFDDLSADELADIAHAVDVLQARLDAVGRDATSGTATTDTTTDTTQ